MAQTNTAAVEQPAATNRDTIVVGASSGGIRALRTLLAGIPQSYSGVLLIVLHQAPFAPTRLPELLQSVTALPVHLVTAETKVLPGHVYVAPPDQHLAMFDGNVLVTREPRENRARPSINTLFRTAAAARPGRTIAVLLTGALDDGVAGLRAVQRCGGIAIVQDPATAEFPELPRRALAGLEADYVAPLEEIAPLLVSLSAQPAVAADVPHDIMVEAQFSRPMPSTAADVDSIGTKTLVACPSCGGPLWKLGDGPTAMYRCTVGHALSETAMLDEQADQTERALWVAVRTLDERATMLNGIAKQTEERGRAAARERAAAEEAAAQAAHLRRFLTSLWSRPAPT